MTFDWVTFTLQIVNVVVLLAILQHFLFRPVADIIAKRQAMSQAAFDDAEKAKAQAEAAKADAERIAARNDADRAEILANAEKEARALIRKRQEEARVKAEQIVAAAEAERERQSRVAERQTLQRASELASAIAVRALASQPSDIKGYAARLAEAIGAMSGPQRDALLNRPDLTLVSPAPLSKGDRDIVLETLGKFGVAPAEATDPDLIAGLELRSGNGVIRNSLAHDLETLSKAMIDGQFKA